MPASFAFVAKARAKSDPMIEVKAPVSIIRNNWPTIAHVVRNDESSLPGVLPIFAGKMAPKNDLLEPDRD